VSRPRLLDLFCGAGGAAMGYHLAGFDVVGVDIKPQPHYPFEFIQGDALEFVKWIHVSCSPTCRDGFDAIHASPPCQEFSTMRNRRRVEGHQSEYGDLLSPTLRLLRGLTVPWVVENVVGARRLMANPLLLEGAMFGLGVHRPRLFCSNVLLMRPSSGTRGECQIGVYGDRPDGRRLNTRSDGTIQRAASSLEEAQTAMGMDWGDWHGVKEAIPPSYTTFIGEQLLAHLGVPA
jgi:DNA (cytosine-5)-methyltransferase 1